MSQTRKDLLPGTLDVLVLKTLTGGSNHGYGIARHIRENSGDVLRVEEGSLYPALHRMERKGWIQSAWGQSETNRRAKYYSITPKGRMRFKMEFESWQILSTAVARVLLVGSEGS